MLWLVHFQVPQAWVLNMVPTCFLGLKYVGLVRVDEGQNPKGGAHTRVQGRHGPVKTPNSGNASMHLPKFALSAKGLVASLLCNEVRDKTQDRVKPIYPMCAKPRTPKPHEFF